MAPHIRTHSDWQIGVFTSLDAGVGVSLETAISLGVQAIHLHAPREGRRHPEAALQVRQQLSDAGLRVEVVYAGFAGESYTDIPTVKETVGLVPAATRKSRLMQLMEVINYARLLGAPAVGLHVGFVPHQRTSEEYENVVEVVRSACGHAAEAGIAVHLETGQEPVSVLIAFIADVACQNLFVNFDPGNMILYGCGDPLEAILQLGGRIRSVHCKDALSSDIPGVEWGVETSLGQGALDVPAFLHALRHIGYQGSLIIERELSDVHQQREDVKAAIDCLQSAMRLGSSPRHSRHASVKLT